MIRRYYPEVRGDSLSSSISICVRAWYEHDKDTMFEKCNNPVATFFATFYDNKLYVGEINKNGLVYFPNITMDEKNTNVNWIPIIFYKDPNDDSTFVTENLTIEENNVYSPFYAYPFSMILFEQYAKIYQCTMKRIETWGYIYFFAPNESVMIDADDSEFEKSLNKISYIVDGLDIYTELYKSEKQANFCKVRYRYSIRYINYLRSVANEMDAISKAQPRNICSNSHNASVADLVYPTDSGLIVYNRETDMNYIITKNDRGELQINQAIDTSQYN